MFLILGQVKNRHPKHLYFKHHLSEMFDFTIIIDFCSLYKKLKSIHQKNPESNESTKHETKHFHRGRRMILHHIHRRCFKLSRKAEENISNLVKRIVPEKLTVFKSCSYIYELCFDILLHSTILIGIRQRNRNR